MPINSNIRITKENVIWPTNSIDSARELQIEYKGVETLQRKGTMGIELIRKHKWNCAICNL